MHRALASMLSAQKTPHATVGVFFVAQEEMERLRESLTSYSWFTGAEAEKIAHEESVDVLAFPEPEYFPHPETKEKFLGEIYINKKAVAGSRESFTKLLAHGLLHLLGYRHHTKRDTMKMKRAERKLWDHILSSDLISEPPPSKR